MSDMASAFDKAITEKIDQRATGLAAIESYKQQLRDGLQRKIDAEHELATKKLTPEMVGAFVEANCHEMLNHLKQGMVAYVHEQHGYIGVKPEQIPDAIAGLALKAKFSL